MEKLRGVANDAEMGQDELKEVGLGKGREKEGGREQERGREGRGERS